MFEFKEITFEYRELIESYTHFKKENSEMNFTNLYIWKDYYQTSFAQVEDMLVFLHHIPGGETVCSYPCGKGDATKCLKALKKYFDSLGKVIIITNANKAEAEFFLNVFPNGTVTENRDFADYIYSTEALLNLSGKKLHAKRNHLNRFKNKYPDYVYREITPDDFSRCLDFAAGTMKADDFTEEISYDAEYRSLKCLFDNFCKLELKGGLIEIDGEIAAFTIGEQYTPIGALIHAEKADVAYDGIYAAINNEFVKHAWSSTEFINREEDMGIEGLRKAKLSYRPCRFVEKYSCWVE